MTALFKDFGMMDYAALAAAAVLVLRGLMRGCSGEVGRLVGAVAAAAAGYFGFAPVARLVGSAHVFGANPYAGRILAFILLSVVCIALWLALRRLLANAIQLAIAQPFDAILGGLFGGIKAFIVVAALCALGLLYPFENGRASFKQDSLTVQKLAPFLKRITSPDT